MPLTTTFVNSIVGLDTGSVPNNSVFYVMATEAAPQTQPPEPVIAALSVVQGPVLNFRLQQPPQLNPNLMFFSQGIDNGSVPANVANWIMAVTADPIADGDWTLTTDLLGNEICSVRPQVASAGH